MGELLRKTVTFLNLYVYRLVVSSKTIVSKKVLVSDPVVHQPNRSLQTRKSPFRNPGLGEKSCSQCLGEEAQVAKVLPGGFKVLPGFRKVLPLSIKGDPFRFGPSRFPSTNGRLEYQNDIFSVLELLPLRSKGV